MNGKLYNDILALLHREVKPALGCTEPIAVAIAVAKGCEALRPLQPYRINVAVSANILKNAMGVGVPGTGMVGLPIATALAMVCGNAEYGMEVLKDLTAKDVTAAKAYLAAGEAPSSETVHISLADTQYKLYIEAECFFREPNGTQHRTFTVIRDAHDTIVHYEMDGRVEIDDNCEKSTVGDITDSPERNLSPDFNPTIREIHDFALHADMDDIQFILDSVDMNKALAKEGLLHKYGLQVGRTIQSGEHRNIFGHGLLTHCMAMTAAASDARMAGCTLPAMANSGSGNQGITVTMPVVAAAEQLMSSFDELARALVLSHLIAIHIKTYLGKLSALCGCVIASTGSACGIVMLSGGGYDQICYAVKNMIGNITGMVCDGAKVGCAMKVASGVSSAVQSAMLALDNICISGLDGIIEDDVEKTIRNLGTIGSQGMLTTDKMILDIMVCK
ncbi:MAG: serine dehydratase subunit alpha family protein [Alistipes sp.]|nr:serine dehydratase subunit alpha family protein [Candidatus Minthomonas equi]